MSIPWSPSLTALSKINHLTNPNPTGHALSCYRNLFSSFYPYFFEIIFCIYVSRCLKWKNFSFPLVAEEGRQGLLILSLSLCYHTEVLKINLFENESSKEQVKATANFILSWRVIAELPANVWRIVTGNKENCGPGITLETDLRSVSRIKKLFFIQV